MAKVLERGRDYLRPEELGPATKSIGATNCNPCWGEEVAYTTFATPVITFQAKRYDGRWVVVLVPVTHPRSAKVSDERLRTLVDRLDILYGSYRDLLGWEPTKSRDPNRRQVFAFRPDQPDWFYGVAMAPGDSSEYGNSVFDELALDDDVLSNVWVHELAHNFDVISRWDFGPDPMHDWTTFIQGWFARRQMRMDDGSTRWDVFETEWSDQRLRSFSERTALSWNECAVSWPFPAKCAGAEQLTGAFLNVLARHVEDPTQIRSWLHRVRTDTVTPSSPWDRSDYILRTLAEATQTDTRCAASQFRWYSGSGLAAAGQFPTAFPGCRDTDLDGSNRFFDCDDSNAQIRPGVADPIDGLDNNCDGLFDERTVDEAAFGDFDDYWPRGTAVSGFPLRVTGALSSGTDSDSIVTERVIPASRARVRLCAVGASMYIYGVSEGRAFGIGTAAQGTCSGFQPNNVALRGFLVAPVSGSTGGSYVLDIDIAKEGWPRPRPITVAADGSNSVRAVVEPARVPGGIAGVELRWTGSGGGVLKAGPLSNPDSLDAPALPAAAMVRATSERHQLRAQLFRNGLPIEEPSRAFTVATEGFALASGVTVSSNLPASANEERWYIDVPDGASRLLVTTTSVQNIDLHAARIPAIVPDVAIPSITAAPARNLASASATTASGNETLTIASPGAGRWYLTPTNNGATAGAYTLRATVDAIATPIRSGGYFNPQRPGHGLFVHPAGGEWAGLWYTYGNDGLPTWYYLQGAAPGGNGQWNGTIFRSRWDGAGGQLHPVGNAVLTPGAERGFSFSYNLDGVAGSEAFRPFGRGCPAIGATAIDASQHYFDPVRSGSGYSVQLMTAPAAYEFFAAFVYDSRGVPRFLVAERNGVGALDASINLQQLRGFCPTCTHAAVTRSNAGSLRRVFNAGGVLQSITLDAGFVDGLRGDWDVTDALRMLDDQRRTQGCTP